MTLDISKIQAICFDIDGTLRDTDDQYVARANLILKPFRWLFPKRETNHFARWLVMRFEGPVNGLFGFADQLGLDGLLHRLIEIANPWKSNPTTSTYQLVPGTIEALDILSKRFPLAIVTARGAKSTRAFLETTGLTSYFAFVASALTSPRGKPQADPILWVAKQLNIQPEALLMVGDTSVDIVAGTAARSQTIAVLSGFGEEEELKKLGANLILPSVAEIPDIFDQKKID
jgi:phosphoglycolate phosphatase-like HAD superfamily hydrolase